MMPNITTVRELLQEIILHFDKSDTCHFITGYYSIFPNEKIFASIHYHKDSAFNLNFENECLSADVTLNKQGIAVLTSVRIQTSNIWTIANADTTSFTGQHVLYSNPEALESN
jgi:hypothetical protein